MSLPQSPTSNPPADRSAGTSHAWRKLALCGVLVLLGVLFVQRPGAYGLTAGVAFLAAAAALLAWLGWSARLRRVAEPVAVAGPVAWLDRAPEPEAVGAAAAGSRGAPAAATQAYTVVYASQTGFAEQIARQTWQSLQDAGVESELVGLDEMDVEALRAARRVLFVTSTTGDGDPPDDAVSFFDQWMAAPAELADLEYGLLALGDRDYDDFCGFGHKLERWLTASGAQPMFDLVEVDSEDESALRHWQQRLGSLSGAADLPDWQAPRYQRWRLVARTLLNPGSQGGPCFQLALQPLEGRVGWEAGDIAEIGPCHAQATVDAWLAATGLDGAATVSVARERLAFAALLARSRLPEPASVQGLDVASVAAILQRLPHREYSIASIPESGVLELLVRQMRDVQGALGLGSRWLTEDAPIGAEIALRVRGNVNFHVPAGEAPLIVIGNGTGMAALHALLATRVASAQRRNWLLFGERQVAHDFFYGAEVKDWLAKGQLERADFAWSRDQPERVHVQDCVRAAADTLRAWVAAGACIYVCGGLAGMAPGVDAELRAALGADQVEDLRRSGRYRRDVY